MTPESNFEKDILPTAQGDLTLIFLGHGSLLFTFQNKNIYVDPYSRVADYSHLPPADLVLITHHHADHLDEGALAAIRTAQTELVLTELCRKELKAGQVVWAGDEVVAAGIPIRAVEAYNIAHTRPDGSPFHPRGVGVGFILTFGDLQVYVAGDTENTPEMKSLSGIDVAFLPMNLPYTMTPEMVADAARAIQPRILYPYHYGTTQVEELSRLLLDQPDIEVRVRKLA